MTWLPGPAMGAQARQISGGTYTVSNVGTFGNVFGTPIINQPQVGILALGAIRRSRPWWKRKMGMIAAPHDVLVPQL